MALAPVVEAAATASQPPAGGPGGPAGTNGGAASTLCLARQPLLQIAPMLDVSYKDFRQFMRLLTKEAQLWTEMHVDSTLVYAKTVDRLLDFEPNEHPVVCQLGGSNPELLAQAARTVEAWGYDEINLNCGCPSDRVCKKGEFGASLMKRPELVRDCVRAIAQAVKLPVTVKCRLGVDDLDAPEFTAAFVRTVAEGGVRHFIIHARKCILQGLSPEQNRKVPPLMYDRVYRLCREFPHLVFSLNGGVNTLEEVRGLLHNAPPNLIGVMLGRAAMNNPCVLWDADSYIYGRPVNPAPTASRHALLVAYCEYLDKEHPPGGRTATASGPGGTHMALKPVLGLFNGLRGNKILRQTLDKLCRDKDLRAEGPGSILRKGMQMLEADDQVARYLFHPLTAAGASSGSSATTPQGTPRALTTASVASFGSPARVATEVGTPAAAAEPPPQRRKLSLEASPERDEAEVRRPAGAVEAIALRGAMRSEMARVVAMECT